MILYFTTFLIIAFLNLIAWKSKRLQSAVLLFSFIALVLISGLRDTSVGIDTINYLNYFNLTVQNGLNLQGISVTNLFVPSGFELGFRIYTYLMSLITNNFTMFLLATSALIYMPVYLFIKRYSTDYFLSFVIYYCLFFFGSMSLLRQSIAMSILLLGTKYILKRNPIKYIAIVLFAASFHVSAIIGLLLYPLYKKRLTRFNGLVTLISASFIFVTMGTLIEIAAMINNRYVFYLDRINSYSVASYLAFCLYFFIFMLLLFLQNRKPAENNKSTDNKLLIKQSFLIITSFAASIVMGLSIKVNSLDRLALIFLVYSIVSIPVFIESTPRLIRKGYVKIFIICLFISYASVVLTVRPKWYGVTNYSINTEIKGR